MGALLLALVAAMTPFVAGPDLAYAQSQSTDTTLYELSIEEQSADTPTVSGFMPAFAPGGAPEEDGYTAYAASSEENVVLTATASHSVATIAVKAGADEESAADVSEGTDANAGTYDVTLGGLGEDTVILVTVTAADDVAMATYKVTVMRGAALSNIVTLSALSLMAGGDEIAFTSDFIPDSDSALTYDALVPNSTTMVEVMATPTDARDGATYAVTSDKDDSVQNNRVDLSEGANVITVTVTGADRVTTGDYTVTVTRVADTVSTDTTLTALSLVNDATLAAAVSLRPTFRSGRAPASSGYTASVAHSVERVTLTVTESHRSATAEVRVGATEAAAMEVAAESGAPPYAFDLQAEGTDTVILVTVTAEDNASKATYKVTVERAANPTSTVTTLSALSVIAGGNELELAPEFTTGATNYAASVPYAVSRATVMATPTNRDATYAVTSDEDNTIQNNRVDLSEGANVITVTVTAADGSTTNVTGTYVVRVTRARSTAARVTTLAELSIEEQSADTPTVSGFMPAFVPDGAPASSGYTAYAASSEANVVLTATASHSAATIAVRVGADEETAMKADPEDSSSPYTVSLPGDTGDDTVILVTVTAADGFAEATYKLTVMRGADGSHDVTLSALSLMAGGNDIDIGTFASGTSAYTASVPNATTMVEVMATPTDARDGATYAVTSDKDSSVQNNQVDLSEGANVITVTVTGADRVTTDDYMVTVTRIASNLSTDTTLSALSLGDIEELDPEFVPNSRPVEGGYAAEVNADVALVTVTATTAHTGASIEVMAGADEAAAMEADAITASVDTGDTYAVDGDAGFQGEGADTVILVTVTAADLATTGTHMITVSRGAADANDELKALMLDGVVVSLTHPTATDPAGTIHGRVIVDVPSVTVMATPRNSMAEVTVTSDMDDDVVDNVVDLAVGINTITVTVDPVTGDR